MIVGGGTHKKLFEKYLFFYREVKNGRIKLRCMFEFMTLCGFKIR